MMGRMPARWRTSTGLLPQFAVLSFLVVGLMTAALCLVISSSLRKDLLEYEWRTTADFIRTEALQNLDASDFSASAGGTAQARFRQFYEQAIMMPEIVRVKIYDAAMHVIWSDEPRLIGQRFPDNPQLRTALAGRTTVNLEIGDRKNENIYERDERQLVEVYVPLVFPGDSRPVGVVETYKEPTRVFINIRRGQLTVISTGLVGAILLYLSLFWIVRRAARRIESQHRELAAANDELRAVQAQLVAAERMATIGEVTTAVAHGIRNPLANIRAAAQVALLDCDECRFSSLGPKGMRNVITEADRLERRLRELLQVVRPAEHQKQALDLNTVVHGALQATAGRMTEAGIVVEEQLASALPPVIGNRVLAEQIVVTLVENAIEAIGSGGTITMVTDVEKSADMNLAVFVEVRDTGIGISPEHLPRIFDLFYTTKAQGTGLGLAIAKKFTDAHGGKLTVESHPGAGSTFRVTFPTGGRD